MAGALNSSLPGKIDLQEYCYPHVNNSCVKSSLNSDFKTMFYVLVMLATSITVLGNSVVIISIAHFKQLQTPTNILVLSLALLDLFVGAFIMPFSMVRSLDGCWYFGEDFCLVHSILDYIFTGASILQLIFIAIDRYQAVCHPLQYPTRVTLPVAAYMAALSWILSIVYAFSVVLSKAYLKGMEDYAVSVYCLGDCFPIINIETALANALIFFILPVFVMIVLYARILLVSEEHARKMEGVKLGRVEMTLQSSRNDKKTLQKVKQEKKAAKTLGLVISVFVLCWLPYCVDCIIDPYINFTTPTVLFEIFHWLGYINSTLNPIIYGLFYPWFRKTLHLIVTLKIFAPNSSDIRVYAH